MLGSGLQLGNKTNRRVNIYVVDKNSPVINVDVAGIKSIYVMGETITVPKATVSDETTHTLKIYVLSPDGKLNFITDTLGMKLSARGKYTIVYLAYDADYNLARKEIEFKVV